MTRLLVAFVVLAALAVPCTATAAPYRVVSDCNGTNIRFLAMCSGGYPASFQRELFDMYVACFVNMDRQMRFTIVVDSSSTERAIRARMASAPIVDPSRIAIIAPGHRPTVWARDFMVALYEQGTGAGGIVSQTHLEGHDGDSPLGAVLASTYGLHHVKQPKLKTAGGDVLSTSSTAFVGIRSIRATAQLLRDGMRSRGVAGRSAVEALLAGFEASTGRSVARGPLPYRFVPYVPEAAPDPSLGRPLEDLDAAPTASGTALALEYLRPAELLVTKSGRLPESRAWEDEARRLFERIYGKKVVVLGDDDPSTAVVEQPISFHVDMTLTPVDDRTFLVASTELGKQVVQSMSAADRAAANRAINAELGWYTGSSSDILGLTVNANKPEQTDSEEAAVRILRKLGYKVVRVPYLVSYGYFTGAKTPWFSYNNCLMERYRDDAGRLVKRVYLPQYCCPALDDAARRVWSSELGYEVVPVTLAAVTAYHGAIRCTTNHLGRKQAEGPTQ